jgi:hypothetical protein
MFFTTNPPAMVSILTSPLSFRFAKLGAPPIPDTRFARSGQEGLIQVFVGTVKSEKRLETKLGKRHEARG